MFFMQLEIDEAGLQQKLFAEDRLDKKNNKDYLEDECFSTLEDIEDVQEIMSLLCEKLENFSLARFRVEGFGETAWPVDVSTDFLAVLEQLPDLIKFLNIDTDESSVFYLDFYEQGIQRRLVFRKNEGLVTVACQPFPINNSVSIVPNASWGRQIEENPIEKKVLKDMVCEIVRNFVLAAKKLCPNLAAHWCFQEWCNSQYIVICLC